MVTNSKAKYLLVAAIGVLLAFVLVSCGSDDDTDTTAAPAPAAAPRLPQLLQQPPRLPPRLLRRPRRRPPRLPR